MEELPEVAEVLMCAGGRGVGRGERSEIEERGVFVVVSWSWSWSSASGVSEGEAE